MSIASSTHTLGPVQADGRRYVTERHTDHLGNVYLAEYLAAPGANYAAIRTARAAQIEAALPEGETDAMLDGSTVAPQHQTPAQLLGRLRERYRGASREQAARIASWLMDRLDAGQVTDAQLQSAFGLTAAQWSALKTRMRNIRTAFLAVQLAQGE